jgi:hypothetical protein
MNCCKKNRNRGHSHMPSEGDIVEPLKHEHPNYRSREKGDERNNPKIKGNGKTKNHDMTQGGNHNLNTTSTGGSYNHSHVSRCIVWCLIVRTVFVAMAGLLAGIDDAGTGLLQCGSYHCGGGGGIAKAQRSVKTIDRSAIYGRF